MVYRNNLYSLTFKLPGFTPGLERVPYGCQLANLE